MELFKACQGSAGRCRGNILDGRVTMRSVPRVTKAAPVNVCQKELGNEYQICV